MSTVSSQISTSPLSSQELSKATHCLITTRDNLHAAVSGLSDAQWHFKPALEQWSIAEILEHVVLIEERVLGLIGRMQEAPASEADRVNSQVEETILSEIPKRLTKFQAPPHVLPAQRWNPAEALARFLDSRARTLELLVEAPALRGHVMPHPIMGNWDGYQWILAAGAHSARHTNQILEVKACASFPGNCE